MDLGAFFGGAVQTLGNLFSAKQAQDFNSDMLDKQIAWQDLWRRTSHQTAVADLRAAGLNPILAASRGAAQPGGGSASGGLDPRSGDAFTQGSSAYAQRRLVDQQLKTEEERSRGERHKADQAEAEAWISDWERRVRSTQEHNFKANGVAAEAERRLEESRAGSTASRLEREIDESAGEVLRSLRRLGISGGSAAQILNLMRERKAPAPSRR